MKLLAPGKHTAESYRKVHSSLVFRPLAPRRNLCFNSDYLLKIAEIKKIKAFTNMRRGPAGKPEDSEIIIPSEEDVTPMTVAPKAYWNIFLLKFLALHAGIAASAAVKRPPTTFTLNATITAIESR